MAEAMQRQADRLDLLATLARPVQHEMNNLLTVVFANLDLLTHRTAEAGPLRQIGRVQEAARRIEATTRAILSLSQRPVSGEALVSPGAALMAIGPLLSLLMPAPGALSVAIAPEIPPCRFDQALFDQALLGLAAMAGAAGARLEIALAGSASEVVLEARTPIEPGDAGEHLARLAREAGGSFAAAAGVLRLALPPATSDG